MKSQNKPLNSVIFAITSSLWASRRQRILRAAKPVSSMLKPDKPASSSFPSPEEAETGLPAGSELVALESDPLLPAEEERSESRARQSWDRWRSNRGRRRTAPGHDLYTQSVFQGSDGGLGCHGTPYQCQQHTQCLNFSLINYSISNRSLKRVLINILEYADFFF